MAFSEMLMMLSRTPLSLSLSLLLSLTVFLLLKKKPGNAHLGRAIPGSMGWPYLGETLRLFSQSPKVFFSTRQDRYGDIFKSHILGCPCVMLASPEAVRFVLVTKAELFKPTYPKSKERLIGPSALFFHDGSYHARMRKLVQGSLSLDVVKSLIPGIEALAASALESWSGAGRVANTFHELKKFTLDVAALSVFGHLENSYKEMLRNNFFTLDKGYNSFSLNLPGTPYRRSLMARRRLGQIISNIINERREKGAEENNLLGSLLRSRDENGAFLTENQIIDTVIGVLFAAQDTTASLLTWIFKFLYDDPEILESIKKEQKEIQETNAARNQTLTWAQTKSMHHTNMFIQESLRMASIISFTYREAIEDVEYQGYIIPKGWKVLPLFRNIHHCKEFFPDPEVFKPARFEVGQRPNTFMPFGNGIHSCPGNEVAKVEMLVMIHHLVNKFGWEVVGSSNKVEYKPFPIPEKGLPAKFWKLESCSRDQEGFHG